MRRRIKKKKGLLPDPAYEKLKERWVEELESEMDSLEKLEEIANSFDGVDTSYAIQAGREVRIIVKPEKVSDSDTVMLAREIAKRIENEMEYPGQIKVNVIRETRTVDVAK